MSDYKTWTEIRNEQDPDGTKHDLRLFCVKCHNSGTCRCSKPKRKFDGICPDCVKKSILQESRTPSKGCLMAMIDKTYGPHVVKIGKTAIPSEILYTKDGDDSYGYEVEPHLTIKYGYTPDLTKRDLAKILIGMKPFDINITGLSLFENAEFDVVKFDINKDSILNELRCRADLFKNEDKYPDYHPHMTLAYVKKGSFNHKRDNLNIKLPVNRFKYSGGNGQKLYINL